MIELGKQNCCDATRFAGRISRMAKRKPGRPRKKPENIVPTEFLHVEIPTELKDRVRKLAEANDRKMTAEVVRAIREHLLRSEAPPRREERP